MIKALFLNKIGRKISVNFVVLAADIVMAICSYILISSRMIMLKGAEPWMNHEQRDMVILHNINTYPDAFNLGIEFAIVSLCLVIRATSDIQYIEAIGPLIKIFEKVAQEMVNFCLLFFVILLVLSLVGNLNYMFYMPQYSNLLESMLTVLNAALGNYDLYKFEIVDNRFLQYMGQIFTIVIVLVFSLLLVNLLISLLAQTYHVYDESSEGLFLKKIMSMRDEMLHDPYFGSFLVTLAPIDLAKYLLAPLSYFMRKGSKSVKRLNELSMQISYVTFMTLIFCFFVGVSLALIPPAWIVGVVDKYYQNHEAHGGQRAKTVNVMVFAVLGMPILCLDLIADMAYFWQYNFNEDLSMIVIQKEPTKVTDRSIKDVCSLCRLYQKNLIKSVYTTSLIKILRRQFEVMPSLQFLIFGQYISQGVVDRQELKKKQTFVSMKTD